MDFWQSLAVLGRRWWVVVPGLLITAVVAVVAFNSITPTYQAHGTVVFYAPGKLQLPEPNADPASAVRSNPFLGFDGSVGVTSEIVARSVVAPSVIRSITSRGASRSFTVEPDLNARGPILQLTATAPTRAGSVAILDRGIAAMNGALAQQQTAVGASKDTWVQMATVRADRTPTLVTSGRAKTVAAIVVLGVALSIAAAFALDAILRARRRTVDEGLRTIAVSPPPVAPTRSLQQEPTRAS